MKADGCLRAAIILWVAAQAVPGRAWSAEMPYQIVGSEKGEAGTTVYRIKSPYQPGTPRVRILAPDKLPPEAERRILFVLPVEPEPEKRWGDGFETVRKLGVHTRLGWVIVAPSFAQWPWYCDHPSDKARGQETYVLKVVLPLVAERYPHEPAHRLLLGFSKSGWGAWSLLLRNPDQFGAAAAWDAPMMMVKPLYGMSTVVGPQEQFERYRIPALLEQHADAVRGRTRLALLGYCDSFRTHHQQCHSLMERLRIPHLYADGPRRKHHWDSGWVEEAVSALNKMIPVPLKRRSGGNLS